MLFDDRIFTLLALFTLALILSACNGLGGAPATATLTPSPTPGSTATLPPSATLQASPGASSPTPAATLTASATLAPTASLLPTRAPSPRLTATGAATARALPTIACDEKGIIQISNTTNAVVELHLTGTGPYLFYLKPGDNSLEVCDGQYDYLAYGCGGESASGTMSTGETHEFYCK